MIIRNFHAFPVFIILAFVLPPGRFVAAQPLPGREAEAPKVGSTLPSWSAGYMDIHQIATGRGNAALVIAPDGTSIMIDAGAMYGEPEGTAPAMPDGSRRPGEWIARYALRQLRATGRARLDYFLVTHLHPDHLGDIGPTTPRSERDSSYVLTGITDVAEQIPIGTVIDRGFPDYTYSSRWPAGFALNYYAFSASRQKAGMLCERLRVGAGEQIRLRYAPERYRSFGVRNIAANGVVWTGEGEKTQASVPTLSELSKDDYPDENMCSLALRLTYGKFDYFTGGDLHCDTRFGQEPWRDVETPVARVSGPVEVAVTNHHAYFDAVGPDSVRALRPLVWIVPAWHLTHLNIAVLERLLSDRLYPGLRDVFVTNLLPATGLLDQRFMPKVRSSSGHIVVRVLPGGDEFRVFITENKDETDTIKAIFGPYSCR